jgi:hypothetical protein
MPEPERHDGPRVVFTHIPKAAGSTIGARLYHLVGPDSIAVATTDNDDLSSILPRIGAVKVVTGHVRYPVIQPYASDAAFFASVRDPIDRIVSNYFFVIKYKGISPDIYENNLRGGFDKFYDMVIRRAGRTNIQSRFFTNSARSADAIEAIRSAYSLVWDSDTTNSAWDWMRPMVCSLLSLDDNPHAPLVDGYVAPRSAHGGVDGSRPESYRDFLGPGAVDAILSENAEDAKLFDWIRSEGGIVHRST